MPDTRRALLPRLLALSALPAALVAARPAAAASRAEIDRDVAAALATLRSEERTRVLFQQARSVLVFPRIVSGGFIVGGQFGEGAMLRGESVAAYYRIAGASFGLTAGAQVSGLAMFFMTDEALAALNRADGWEIGTGPSVVAFDAGLQANVTATTLREPVYAITFNQQGLMASLALNGTKITRIEPG
jgi:lipid-binding SYLF domain-containing protein